LQTFATLPIPRVTVKFLKELFRLVDIIKIDILYLMTVGKSSVKMQLIAGVRSFSTSVQSLTVQRHNWASCTVHLCTVALIAFVFLAEEKGQTQGCQPQSNTFETKLKKHNP
jgi:hypothetical protein